MPEEMKPAKRGNSVGQIEENQGATGKTKGEKYREMAERGMYKQKLLRERAQLIQSQKQNKI